MKTHFLSTMSAKASEDALLWGAKAPVVATDANAPHRPIQGRMGGVFLRALLLIGGALTLIG